MSAVAALQKRVCTRQVLSGHGSGHGTGGWRRSCPSETASSGFARGHLDFIEVFEPGEESILVRAGDHHGDDLEKSYAHRRKLCFAEPVVRGRS